MLTFRIAKAKVAGSNPVFRSSHKGPALLEDSPRTRALVFALRGCQFVGSRFV